MKFPKLHDFVIATGLVSLVCTEDIPDTAETPWIGWGGNPSNNRWASTNRHISSASIQTLSTSCQIPFPGGLSATPSILNSIVYFPTWNGSFYALDYTTCRVKWAINVTQVIRDFAPVSKNQALATIQASRTSAQIDDEARVVYFSTQTHALMVALDLDTGSLLAVKQIHSHELAVITLSSSLHNGIIYTGSASEEESVPSALPAGSYPRLSFTGTISALRLNRHSGTFDVVWEVQTSPPNDPRQNPSWAGVGIWGSGPPIDEARNQIVYATGNVYTVPVEFQQCANTTGENSVPYGTCFPDNVWEEAIVAVDLTTGHVNWVQKLNHIDTWSLTCGNSSTNGSISELPAVTINFGSNGKVSSAAASTAFRRAVRNPELCPQSPGFDTDFGMAPVFVSGGNDRDRDVLAIGQKNGFLYTLDPSTGQILSASVVGPGGAGGGMSWGIAADNEVMYFTEINFANEAWRPQPGNDTEIKNSAYGAADLRTGNILWETPVPQNQYSNAMPTVVGDLVFAGRSNRTIGGENPGTLVVMLKATGKVLQEVNLDSYFQGSIAVYGKYVMFGTGYRNVVPGSFYAMQVD